MCEHIYNYLGVMYYDGKWPLPGTGARRRYYSHVYFCTRCAETLGKPIEDRDRSYTTYEHPRFNAVPGSAVDCGVPLEDR